MFVCVSGTASICCGREVIWRILAATAKRLFTDLSHLSGTLPSLHMFGTLRTFNFLGTLRSFYVLCPFRTLHPFGMLVPLGTLASFGMLSPF